MFIFNLKYFFKIVIFPLNLVKESNPPLEDCAKPYNTILHSGYLERVTLRNIEYKEKEIIFL